MGEEEQAAYAFSRLPLILAVKQRPFPCPLPPFFLLLPSSAPLLLPLLSVQLHDAGRYAPGEQPHGTGAVSPVVLAVGLLAVYVRDPLTNGPEREPVACRLTKHKHADRLRCRWREGGGRGCRHQWLR